MYRGKNEQVPVLLVRCLCTLCNVCDLVQCLCNIVTCARNLSNIDFSTQGYYWPRENDLFIFAPVKYVPG